MSESRTMPTITYIIGSLEVGGAEMHLSQVAPALKKKGFEVEVISLTPRLALKGPFVENGIPVYAPGEVPPAMPHMAKRIINFVLRTVFLFKMLLKRRRNILHFFLPEAYILGTLVSILTRHRGLRIMSRRSMNYYQKRRPFLGTLERLLHRYVHAFLCNSRAVKEQLVHDEGISDDLVSVIYNGVSPGRIANMREKNLKEHVGLHLMCVANLIHYKGHMDLLVALDSVQSQLPKNWALTLIGQDRGIKAILVEKLAQSGMTEQVDFVHDCDNPMPYLFQGDIGILCSHEEGFSNAILEMMAAGLPVIATNVGGNAEAVKDALNGYIVPARRPDLLAKAILALAIDSEKRKIMGKESKIIFQSYFSLDACVNAYGAFYERAVSRLP